MNSQIAVFALLLLIYILFFIAYYILLFKPYYSLYRQITAIQLDLVDIGEDINTVRDETKEPIDQIVGALSGLSEFADDVYPAYCRVAALQNRVYGTPVPEDCFVSAPPTTDVESRRRASLSAASTRWPESSAARWNYAATTSTRLPTSSTMMSNIDVEDDVTDEDDMSCVMIDSNRIYVDRPEAIYSIRAPKHNIRMSNGLFS